MISLLRLRTFAEQIKRINSSSACKQAQLKFRQITKTVTVYAGQIPIILIQYARGGVTDIRTVCQLAYLQSHEEN